MRVIQFAQYGPADVLQLAQRETPAPGPGEVLIHVAAAAVNPADHKWRSGMFRDFAPVPLPHVLGYDVAGTVAAVGEGVEAFAAGERVFCMLDPIRKGGYAEFAVASAAAVARLPADLELELAATLPTPGLTGVQLIQEHVRPAPGETVLVTGAVGAVGRFAVQTAREFSARVVAAVRAGQRDLARSLAAAEVVTLGETPSPDTRFDHVADTVGGAEVAELCRRLTPGGRIATVATAPIDPRGLPLPPVVVAVRPGGAMLAAVGRRVARGEVAVAPARALPLSEAAEAHRRVEAGALSERIVLRP